MKEGQSDYSEIFVIRETSLFLNRFRWNFVL